jgi:hypothetical protein
VSSVEPRVTRPKPMLLELTPAAFDEIQRKLYAAGYAFDTIDQIDMTGIAVVRQTESRGG